MELGNRLGHFGPLPGPSKTSSMSAQLEQLPLCNPCNPSTLVSDKKQHLLRVSPIDGVDESLKVEYFNEHIIICLDDKPGRQELRFFTTFKALVNLLTGCQGRCYPPQAHQVFVAGVDGGVKKIS